MAYELLGKNTVINLAQADPVQCCLKGKAGTNSMFTCPDNPIRRDIGFCKDFLSQRCAKNWDGYCTLFLQEQADGYVNGQKVAEFLSAALEARFCRLDTTDPNTKCWTRCEMFNPVSPYSTMICKTQGDSVVRSNSDLYNLNTNFPWENKLDTVAPIKIQKCPKVCDTIATEITDDDFILNECLDRGIALETLMNIAQNIVSKGVKCTNTRMNNFIQRYIISIGYPNPDTAKLESTNVLTTSNVRMPNVDPMLPKNKSLSFNPEATDNFMYQPKVSNTMLSKGVPVKQKEGFALSKKNKKKCKGPVIPIVLLLLLGICLYLYYTSNKESQIELP